MDQGAQAGSQAVPRMEEILRGGATCLLTVTGYSMVPFLRHGRDAVILAQPTRERLRPGRILFFRRPGGDYILHRLRRVERDGSLILCGDAQSWTERIRPSQIIGAAVAVRRETGRVVDCGSFSWRLCSALWYPTRPIRPLLFRIWTAGKKCAAFLGAAKKNKGRKKP